MHRLALVRSHAPLAAAVTLAIMITFAGCRSERPVTDFVSTLSVTGGEFGEPFGITEKDGQIYVSDGDKGVIYRISDGGGDLEVFAAGFHTPSGIAFTEKRSLIVADSGSHTIKEISANGSVEIVAGVEGRSGFADGDAASALFNSPIGVAVSPSGAIFVADTYNDRIRVIEKGTVRTLSGSVQGFADGAALVARYDTPCGIALLDDSRAIVADSGNGRIRLVNSNGTASTLAGNGTIEVKDDFLSSASFFRPVSVAVLNDGSIYVADGNAIRVIEPRIFPFVRTISPDVGGGSRDGPSSLVRFNRPSGLVLNAIGRLLVTDSENRSIRVFSGKSKISATSNNSDAIVVTNKPNSERWPFDPPTSKREIAGTLGEIRGELADRNSTAWFHNGLDIAGGYGETAYFIRDEKVLDPFSAKNFDSLRELIRLPETGYVHVRLGRDSNNKPFGDARFQFRTGTADKLNGVRIPRGSEFRAGEKIGSLNRFNHVHLITGRSGAEQNALAALSLPGLTDSRPPTIERITLFDEAWQEIETGVGNTRIKLSKRVRIVMRAFDQLDGNAERRRLGLYQAGYQVFTADGSPVSPLLWNINFERMPPNDAVNLVYASGSRSGVEGATVFNYIVTNKVSGDKYQDGYLEVATLDTGRYKLCVSAADFHGNITSKEIEFEVVK
ncbi:MAG: hypothetical protein WBD22_02040 [Pyrinomonadaceae bacterium]